MNYDSEDERIRTAILNHLKKMWANCHDDICGVHVEDAIDWLEKQGKWSERDIHIMNNIYDFVAENTIDMNRSDAANECLDWLKKQGESKCVDNIEPKFKVGDWVIDNQGIVHQISNIIENVTNHTYGYDIVGGGYFNDKTEGIRLWTVQDTKPGDVLEFEDHERVVVGIISFVNDRTGKVDVSCLLEDNKFKIGNFYALDTINPRPATKEQRDFLFQKMKDAGYEWDAEKKEVRKIEPHYPWVE